MTFSIVAYSPEEESWGVAVASKFLAVGSVVSWAQAGVGAIATQAFAKVTFGPDGLRLLATGLSAEETLAKLLATDPEAEHRQVGVVDTQGGAAAHTGADCFDYAGHYMGEGFTCQGNILAGRVVIDTMVRAYLGAKGSLADRLLETLLAGDRVGGDKRGRQSAAVLVVKTGGGYGGDNDRFIDLRVDDHDDPIPRLRELLTLRSLYFDKTPLEKRLPIDNSIASELQVMLKAQGHYQGEINGFWDEPTREAFWALVGVENLEERWSPDDHPEKIDPVALEFLRRRFKK